MHGKPSFHKTMRKIKSGQAKSGNPYRGSYMEIGNWRFEENENGDLVIINLETNKTTIFMKK